MGINVKIDQRRQRKTLLKEINRKDWFDTIIKEIDNIEKIYSDPRLKGYMRERHEKIINEHINIYLATDRELQKFAREYFTQAKKDGERKRMKGIENQMKTLEEVLKKEEIPLATKGKFIEYIEEQIVSQIPPELLETYLKIPTNYRENLGLKKKNEQ